MIARLSDQAAPALEFSADQLHLLASAVTDYAAHHHARAMSLTQEAEMRRALSEKYARGRRANIRVAGELEASAARHRRRAEAAVDLLRILTHPLTEARNAGQMGD